VVASRTTVLPLDELGIVVAVIRDTARPPRVSAVSPPESRRVLSTIRPARSHTTPTA